MGMRTKTSRSARQALMASRCWGRKAGTLKRGSAASTLSSQGKRRAQSLEASRAGGAAGAGRQAPRSAQGALHAGAGHAQAPGLAPGMRRCRYRWRRGWRRGWRRAGASAGHGAGAAGGSATSRGALSSSVPQRSLRPAIESLHVEASTESIGLRGSLKLFLKRISVPGPSLTAP